jgi:hypothetical protein
MVLRRKCKLNALFLFFGGNRTWFDFVRVPYVIFCRSFYVKLKGYGSVEKMCFLKLALKHMYDVFKKRTKDAPDC